MLIMKYALVLLLLTSLTKCEEIPRDESIKCLPEFPHFSAGDLNLTKENYESFKTKSKVFVLGLSDSDCEKCCYMESMLNHLKNLLSTKFAYKGKSIPVARIDIKTARGSFATDLPNVSIFPKILFYKEGKYYIYYGYMHYPLILYFFNRVLYPSIRLNTTEEIYRFFDIDREWPDWSPFYDYGNKYEEIGRDKLPKRLVRAIAFVNSKQEYKQEVDQIRDAIQRLSPREDFRFAFVYNKETIKTIKTLQPNWFSEYSSNSIVLQRKPNDTTSFDLASENTNYFLWFTE